MMTPRCCFALMVLFGIAGCGGGSLSGGVHPVTGQVVLADGKPLPGGEIVLIPSGGGTRITGDIDLDGTYSMKAPPGAYKVRIGPGTPPAAKKRGRAFKPAPVPAKYRDEEGNTGLTATVKSGPNQLEPFRLDAK